MNRLLASSPTEEGIKKCLAEYFFSSPESFKISGKLVFKNGKQLNSVQIRKKQNRFRLEMLDINP